MLGCASKYFPAKYVYRQGVLERTKYINIVPENEAEIDGGKKQICNKMDISFKSELMSIIRYILPG